MKSVFEIILDAIIMVLEDLLFMVQDIFEHIVATSQTALKQQKRF